MRKNHFKPLFIYSPDEGTQVYYDKYDPLQSPQMFTLDSNKRPEALLALFEKGEKIFDELRIECRKKKPSLSRLYAQCVKAWTVIAMAVVFGADCPDIADKRLLEEGLRSRKKNDAVVYEADEVMHNLLKSTVPKVLSEYYDVLLIDEVLKKKLPPIRKLQERKRGYVYWNGEIHTGDKDAILRKLRITIFDCPSFSKNGSVAGKGVSSGIARGRVRICLQSTQAHKVQEGEILVTGMTTPDFLFAIKKAGAIVTDEGGLTCHAAITAR